MPTEQRELVFVEFRGNNPFEVIVKEGRSHRSFDVEYCRKHESHYRPFVWRRPLR